MFNMTFWRFSVVSLCLTLGPALWSVPAAAQGSRKESSANNVQQKKQYVFEVVSIRPHKPGTEPFPVQYLPDGYKETLNFQRAIMLAYLPQPAIKWSSSKILNAPAWVANDMYDIDARVAPEDVAAWEQALDNKDYELLSSAWQTVLRERCNLALHITAVRLLIEQNQLVVRAW